MKSPIDHILCAFGDVQLIHLWPLAVIVPVVLFVALQRRGKPRSYTWVKGKGFVGSHRAAIERGENSDDPRVEDLIEKIRKDIAE